MLTNVIVWLVNSSLCSRPKNEKKLVGGKILEILKFLKSLLSDLLRQREKKGCFILISKDEEAKYLLLFGGKPAGIIFMFYEVGEILWRDSLWVKIVG